MAMKRRISRRIEFSVEEVKDALVAYLDSKSQAVPENGDAACITLGVYGAVLEWDDKHEMAL